MYFIMAFLKKKRYAKKSRPVARKRRPYGKKSSAVSTSVKKYVNSVVHKNMENKSVVKRGELEFGTYTATPNMACTAIFPTSSSLVITQGSGAGERIGNVITTRRLNLKYILYPTGRNDGTNLQPFPKEVIIWIGYLRGTRITIPSSTGFVDLFQDGNSSNSPYSDLWDVMMPINKDVFHVCKTIRHKIGNSIVVDFDGQIKEQSFASNNDFKLNSSRSLNLSSYLGNKVRFDDATVASTSGLYMWMTAVNANNSLDYSQSVATVGMSYILTYDYEDA